MDGVAAAAQACVAGPPPHRGIRAALLDHSASPGGLFADLVVSARPRQRGGTAWAVSLIAHAVTLVVLVVAPLLSTVPPPAARDYVRVLIYDPPPPPPPPPPKGSPLGSERTAADRVTRKRTPLPRPEAPSAATPPAMPEADPGPDAAEPQGSPGGADSGVPEGMEGGVEEGVVGGVPGGVVGGVIGGTGQSVVRGFDRAPRLLRQTRPRYPQEAFVKRIEGTVLVEFVIDANGRVVTARILQSIPLLDPAALEAVREWTFTPAYEQGVPVASVARAPVVFRIY